MVVWLYRRCDGARQRPAMLTLLEYIKEMHVLRPDRQIGWADVIRLIRAVTAEQGAPEFIRSDNGPEFVAKELQQWLAE